MKLQLQYHQNERVLCLVAASLRAFSRSCSGFGIHTVQQPETGGIVWSVRIRRRHLLSCDVRTIYLYWCHHSGGSAWLRSLLSSSLLWRFRQPYGNFGIFQECDVNWERSEDENVLMFRFCRGVGLSYVALFGCGLCLLDVQDSERRNLVGVQINRAGSRSVIVRWCFIVTRIIQTYFLVLLFYPERSKMLPWYAVIYEMLGVK